MGEQVNCMNRLIFVLMAGLAAPLDSRADDPELTAKQKLQLEVDMLKLLVEKGEQEKKLRDQQTAAATPNAASAFVQRSGVITGGEKFGFAIYLSAVRPLGEITAEVCRAVRATAQNDAEEAARKNSTSPPASGGQAPTVFVTAVNVPAVTDQWQSTRLLLASTTDRLKKLREDLEPEVDALGGRTAPTKSTIEAEAASLAAAVGTLDVATGLIKGIAGIVNLFKTERVVDGADITLTEKEVRGSLARCNPPLKLVIPEERILSSADITLADQQLAALRAAKGDFDALLTKVKRLKLADAARADQKKKDAAEKEKKKRAAQAEKEKEEPPAAQKDKNDAAAASDKQKEDAESQADAVRTARIAQIETEMTAVQAGVDQAVNAFYAPDATTGVSKMVAWARATSLMMDLPSAYRLSVSVVKAGGYSQTVKHWIADDDLYAAGGAAVYYALYDGAGALKRQDFLYAQSDWNHLDLKNVKPALIRSNFQSVQPTDCDPQCSPASKKP
jgi:hypothetical protein